MPRIFIEPGDRGGYVALRNKRVIARGDTQAETGAKAHEKDPSATIEAARVRTTENGKPDEYRVLYNGE